jgi:hypothetical protein
MLSQHIEAQQQKRARLAIHGATMTQANASPAESILADCSEGRKGA